MGVLENTLSVSFSQKDRAAIVRIRLTRSTPLGTVLQAIYPVFLPRNGVSGYGSPHIAVAAPGSANTIAYLPGGDVRRPGSHNATTTLPAADFSVSGISAKEVEGAQPIRVLSSGGIQGSPVLAPAIDLLVHNPQGRVSTSPAHGLTVAQLRLGGSQLHTVDSQTGKVVIPAFDVRRPLAQVDSRHFTRIDAVNLGALAWPERSQTRFALISRLTEIAATGCVLFGGRQLTESAPPRLPRALLDSMQAPEAARAGAALERASVHQRVAVMRECAGSLQLTSHLQAAGHARLPQVSALLVTNRPGAVQAAVERMAAQSYPELEVIVAIHGFPAPDTSSWSDGAKNILSHMIEVARVMNLGQALRIASERASGELVTKVDDDDVYGVDHIWQLVLAHMYSGAQLVGKPPEFTYIAPLKRTVRRGSRSEAFVNTVAGGTMLMRTSDLMGVGGWRPVPRSVDRALLDKVLDSGGLVYATSGVDFTYVRSDSGHTWSSPLGHFLKNNTEQWRGLG